MAEDTQSSSHPPLPPTTEDDRLSWLRLLRSRRVGIATFFRLMAEHGTASAALGALPGVAAKAGVERYTPFSESAARAELNAGEAAGARLIAIGEEAYPAYLARISDPPPLLWALGHLPALERPAIALVGARNASSLGTRMTRKLAGELTEAGYVIVSGLARGVDTAAHVAAKNSGTVAVLAGGVDVVYPAENAGLAADLLPTGARISEQPMGLVPQARHFPRRNRIISGMAQAVVVVEAAARSGSLITARMALDQGREVLAVPGHPFDARAGGCNMLIRDGARLVRGADDVIEALTPLADPAPEDSIDSETDTPAKPARALRDIARLHEQILNRLGPSPLAEDQLIRDLATPAQEVAPALLDLELDGKIHRQPGGLIARAV